MPKHLIIDGYNLLGVRGLIGQSSGPPGESVREHLLQELARYRQRKPHAITVVFDGWQQGMGSERHEHRLGIEVIYSRRRQRADQVIQRLSEEYGHDCAVVSSDREVADYARARGAFVIEAYEFETKLRHRPTPTPSAAAPGIEKRDGDDGDGPARRPDKKGNPKKLPKAMRKRKRQLNGF